MVHKSPYKGIRGLGTSPKAQYKEPLVQLELDQALLVSSVDEHLQRINACLVRFDIWFTGPGILLL